MAGFNPVFMGDVAARASVQKHVFSALCVCLCVFTIYYASRHTWGHQPGTQWKVNMIFLHFVLVLHPHYGAFAPLHVARRARRSLSLVDREVELCIPIAWSLSTFGYDVRNLRSFDCRVATVHFYSVSLSQISISNTNLSISAQFSVLGSVPIAHANSRIVSFVCSAVSSYV